MRSRMRLGDAAENARRDPVARQAAQVAKRKADEEQAHAERVGKICDSIPEKAMRDDPSLRRCVSDPRHGRAKELTSTPYL